jgi:hypothetical protein
MPRFPTIRQERSMRNLIGRLNARDPADLDRIASAWRVPLTASEKAGVVAQIVRTLTDIRAVRDAWVNLDEDARAIVAILAGSGASQTIPDLAVATDRDPGLVRDIAIRLYRAGWIAREGDNSELRIDETPRLFTPLELAHSVRRIRAEQAAGDRSALPLPKLLDELDIVELEDAANRWGIPVVPGLRSRTELQALIANGVTDPDAARRVRTALGRDALALLEIVRNGPADGVPLADALSSAELDIRSGTGQDRVRAALGQLERGLLVWHGYDWKGERVLFMPAEIRTPQPKPPPTPPHTLKLADTEPVAPYHYHLAWDLLTLLRNLSSADPPRTRPGERFPVAFLERLNRRFWHRGNEAPPPGYVPFLTSLALAEGLIVLEESRGPMVVASDLRSWRDRSFEDQDARLRWRWLAAIEWIEGADQTETHVWGADWRSMRRQILEAFAEIEDHDWRPLDQFVTWIFEREPALLGRAYTVAVAVGINDSGAEGRRAAALSVVSITLRRAFAWLGLIEIRRAAAHGMIMRITPRGRAVATGQALDTPGDLPVLSVGNDATISLANPSPLHIWSVSAFADQSELGPVARYRLTPRSIERAIEAGFQANQIASFLKKQSGCELPAGVADLLDKEQRDHPIIEFERATVVTPVSESARAELLRVLTASGIDADEVNGDLIVRARGATETRLAAILRSAGFVIREPRS